MTSAGGWEPTRDGTGGCLQPRFPHLYNGHVAAPTHTVHTADPTPPSSVNSETQSLKLEVVQKNPSSPLGGCFLDKSVLQRGVGKLWGTLALLTELLSGKPGAGSREFYLGVSTEEVWAG